MDTTTPPTPTTAQGADTRERELFEARFPMPSKCSWAGVGYCATEYSAWEAHDYATLFKGWKAGRASISAPAPVADTREALRAAVEALEEIALAGMSGTGQESDEGMRDWHARRAWEFIRIAARALEPARAALAAPVAAEGASTVEGAGGWQPIESAPVGTDDTILICTEGCPGSAGEAFWHDGSECYGHRGEAGWFWESDRGNLLIASNAVGTHWMPLPPLPAPPSTQGDGNG